MVGSIQTVLECDHIGVHVISVREPWLDTSGPMGALLVAIFGWVAKQERTRLIERGPVWSERGDRGSGSDDHQRRRFFSRRQRIS